MRLQEAIDRAREKARDLRILSTGNKDGVKCCIEQAEEHEQFADWLEELKKRREYMEKHRYHDLRKDATDLPEMEGIVHVILNGRYGIARYENAPATAYYWPDEGFEIDGIDGLAGELNNLIVAWKHPEEFRRNEE